MALSFDENPPLDPVNDRRERLSALARGLPDTPGVYLMKDAAETVIYIGKAGSLRNRVGSYFVPSVDLGPKKQPMPERTERSGRRHNKVPDANHSPFDSLKPITLPATLSDASRRQFVESWSSPSSMGSAFFLWGTLTVTTPETLPSRSDAVK